MAAGESETLRPTMEGTFCSDIIDVLQILSGVREGVLNSISRRPQDSDKETLIISGNIFVYETDTSGIKRWTDGKFWSPSRSLAPYLAYREVEKEATGGGRARRARKAGTQPSPSSSSATHPLRWIRGSLESSYNFVQGGLVKRTFTLAVNGIAMHLVAYNTIEDVLECQLRPACRDPRLAMLMPNPQLIQALPKNPSTGQSIIGDDFFGGADPTLKEFYAPGGRYPRFFSFHAYGIIGAVPQWPPGLGEATSYTQSALEFTPETSAYQPSLDHDQQAPTYVPDGLPQIWESSQQAQDYGPQASGYSQPSSAYPEQALGYNEQVLDYAQHHQQIVDYSSPVYHQQAVDYSSQAPGYHQQAVDYSQQQASNNAPPLDLPPFPSQLLFQQPPPPLGGHTW